jgi:hypothetical protein
MRVVAATLAVERFHNVQGHWPLDWNEVKDAGYIAAVPIDFYNGQPLRLKLLAEGLIVYSVGPNETDDGGAPFHDLYPGPGVGDIAFRLWNPERRRQPPAEAITWPKEDPAGR